MSRVVMSSFSFYLSNELREASSAAHGCHEKITQGIALGGLLEASDRVTVWMSIAATVRTGILVKVQGWWFVWKNQCFFFRWLTISKLWGMKESICLFEKNSTMDIQRCADKYPELGSKHRDRLWDNWTGCSYPFRIQASDILRHFLWFLFEGLCTLYVNWKKSCGEFINITLFLGWPGSNNNNNNNNNYYYYYYYYYDYHYSENHSSIMD